MQICVHTTQAGRRFDKYVRMCLPHLPLSLIYRLIRTAKISCNEKKTSLNYLIQPGDVITIPDTPHANGASSTSFIQSDTVTQTPVDLPYMELWKNKSIVAVSKHTGVTIQTSFLDSLQQYALSNEKHAFHPHPVHRLDTKTSGVLLISRNLAASQTFNALFHDRKIIKQYLCLVEGRISKPTNLTDIVFRDKQRAITQILSDPNPMGVEASTNITPLSYNKRHNVSLITCIIHTGRTHQIRAQTSHIGHPIVGDRKYDSTWKSSYYALHAHRYTIPKNKCTPAITIEAPIPQHMRNVLLYFHMNKHL